MKKIKLECWWTDSGNLTRRFIEQFVSDIDRENYEFVYGEDYDYLVVFGRTDWENIKVSKDRILYFSQEPLWSHNETKDIHQYSDKIFVADKRLYPESDSYKEGLFPMFYGAKGEYDSRLEFDWSKKIFESDLSQSKTKSISMVVTKNYNSHVDQFNRPELFDIIYKKRTDLGIALSEVLPRVDIWGVYWEDNGINLHGEAWNKRVALNNHKFSIACENTVQKNYISEKFWDCVLTETVPIYLGCNNIYELVPEGSFIYLNPDMDDMNKMISTIKEVEANDDALYEMYLPKIKALKQEFIHGTKYNLWNKIKSEIE